MHELVVASGIVDAVSNYAREENRRVASFTVSIGELAGFNKDLIEGLLRDLVKNSPLENAKILVRLERATVKCLTCSSVWGLNDLVESLSESEREMIHFLPELVSAFSKCPKCSSHDLQIESGRSVRVVGVELE